MIAARGDSGLTVITQHDHAAMAADLLALWREGGIAAHRQREVILWATREHDNGWQESDAAPLVGHGGNLLGYRSVPASLRREIWLRGCQRYTDNEPLGSWMIIEHGRQLHQSQRDEPAWADFFDALDSLQAEIGERCPEVDEINGDYDYLRRVDTLSLALCERVRSAELESGFFLQRVDDVDEVLTYSLKPFPFAGSTRFRVAARNLSQEKWETSSRLLSDLVRARWQRVEYLLQP